MAQRLNFREINEKAANQMAAVGKHVGNIDVKLKALVELRVSQLNGCAFCVDLHCQELREAGETQQRIDCLTVWEECEFYEEYERVALSWAEALTFLEDSAGLDDLFDSLQEIYNDEEIVDLTVIIAMMNAWNRMGIGFGRQPEQRA